MIRVIDYQKIDITNDEYKYYQELVKSYTDESQKGSDFFRNLFETNDNGIITIIKPIKSIPWSILFFIQNIMINQKLRENDRRLDKIEKFIK